ncbi:MAG: hypothetical protein LBL66_05795, partial [Clostridiales bacterium]|nr:hypothetical protein [Clostridiales bacterium]
MKKSPNKRANAAAVCICAAVMLLVTGFGLAAPNRGASADWTAPAGGFTDGLTFNANSAVSAGLTKDEINEALQDAIDAINGKIRGAIAAAEEAADEASEGQATATNEEMRNAIDELYLANEIPFFSKLGMSGGSFEITAVNRYGSANGFSADQWARYKFDSTEDVLTAAGIAFLNDGIETWWDNTVWHNRGGAIHFNFKTGEPVFITGPMMQVFNSGSNSATLSNAIANRFNVTIADDNFWVQNFIGGYIKYNKGGNSLINKHEGYYHFRLLGGGDINYTVVSGKNMNAEGEEIAIPSNAAGIVGAIGFADSRDGLKPSDFGDGTKTTAQIAALYASAYENAFTGVAYGAPFDLGIPAKPVRLDFGEWSFETGPGSIEKEYVQRFRAGQSTADGASLLMYNLVKDTVFAVRNEFYTTFLANTAALKAPTDNDFLADDGLRYQNFTGGYIKVENSAATVVTGRNIGQGGEVEFIIDAPKTALPGEEITLSANGEEVEYSIVGGTAQGSASLSGNKLVVRGVGTVIIGADDGDRQAQHTVTVSLPVITAKLSGDKDVLSVSGKGWTDYKAAFELFLNDINATIMAAYAAEKTPAAIYADGEIPFYSANNAGYLTDDNFDSFGEGWRHQWIAADVFMMVSLSVGRAHTSRNTGTAFVAYNAKTDTAVPMTLKIGETWRENSLALGMPVAAAFEREGKLYQNFSNGYVVAENYSLTVWDAGTAAIVNNKNIDESTGVETAADSNAAGWVGAVALTGSSRQLSLLSALTTDDEIKAVSLAFSEKYDSLVASGFNPGVYSSYVVNLRGEDVFCGMEFRYGDSVAVVAYDNDIRKNLAYLVYNADLERVFLLRDEVAYAVEIANAAVFEIGAPVSDVFENDGARYQMFGDGYIRITGGVSNENALGRLTVLDDSETVETAMAAKFAALVAAAETAYAEGSGFYAFGWDAFADAYGKIGGAEPDTLAIDELLDLYTPLAAAAAGLVSVADAAALDDAKQAASDKITEGNTDYTAAGWSDFLSAVEIALALPEDGGAQVAAKIAALNAALDGLVSLDDVLDEVKGELQAVDNGDKAYTDGSWADFTAARAEAEAMPETSAVQKEAKIDALLDAQTLLAPRQNQSALFLSGDAAGAVGAGYTLTAEGGSGDGEITYEITGGTAAEGAAVTGGVLTVARVGTIVIRAKRAGG